MKKNVFYSEISYILGIVFIALGTALTVLGDFGISMVVAPAYILHLKMFEIFPWFTFGVAEYVLQAGILLVMMVIVRKVKLSYFLSFLTAVLYAFLLDGAGMLLALLLPAPVLWQRLAVYIAGDLITCAGVAMIFRTYIPPEAYEMFVKELSSRFGLPLHRVKTVYDLGSLGLAVAMSFLLLGSLQGIGVATVITAFLNGTLIRLFDRLFDKTLRFEDKLPFRKKFEESEEKI